MPHAPSRLSRRGFLTASAIGAAALVAACQDTSQHNAEVENLQSQLDLATRDSASASAAAVGLPDSATALTAVATIRKAHAAALSNELQRVTGTKAHRPASTTTTAPGAAADLDLVRNQLRESANSAKDAATRASGYRAGLLASISAACASSAKVDLS